MSAGANTTKIGVSFGCALAMTISYTHYHSILWAIVHGVCSWLYVIHFAIYGVQS